MEVVIKSNELIEPLASKADVAHLIKQQIADRMVLYGHTVKVSETYCSEKLVVYSQCHQFSNEYAKYMDCLILHALLLIKWLVQYLATHIQPVHLILHIHRFSGMLASSL